MTSKFSFGEGASLNRPPLFFGENYQPWCIRMIFFVDTLDRRIWNVITNNAFIHLLENNAALSKNEKDHLDCVAKNIIVFVLDSDELLFLRIRTLRLGERARQRNCALEFSVFLFLRFASLSLSWF